MVIHRNTLAIGLCYNVTLRPLKHILLFLLYSIPWIRSGKGAISLRTVLRNIDTNKQSPGYGNFTARRVNATPRKPVHQLFLSGEGLCLRERV